MNLHHLALSLILSLSLLPGCPGSDDDDSWSDDDSAGDDDDAVGDDDDVSDDDDATVPASTDGNVSVTLYRMPDGMGGVMEGGNFSAMFFEEIVAPTGGVEHTMPTGPEDCQITLYTDQELHSGTQGQYAYFSAGELTVDGPNGSFVVQPMGGTVVTYQHVMQLGADLVPGGTYDVDAAGAEFPSFQASIDLPDDLDLHSPAVTQTLQIDGAVDVQWSTGSDATVYISVSSTDGQDYGYIYCEAANDGSFTVPANLIDQMPAGTANLSVTQAQWDYVEVDGYWVYLFGAVYVTASGFVG